MKPEGALKRLLDTKKTETKIVGPVERMLLGRDPWDMHLGNGEVAKRRWDVIHPSELANAEWCPRAAYYRIVHGPVAEDQHRFQTQVIFEEGHEYHRKWQTWAWDLGVLRGRFNCTTCMPWSETFEATAPKCCTKCGAPRRALNYREVPLKKKSHLISGSSDGDINEGDDVPLEDHPLIEIKSIGTGTIRMEAPQLLRKHTYKVETESGKTRSVLDIEALWREIRRPFPNHLRQALIYCFCLGRNYITFIYEFKNDGRTKEFTVKADFKYIEDLLDQCVDVKHAVESGNPPPCRKGKKKCEVCLAYEEQLGEREPEEEPRPRSGQGPARGRKKVVRRGRSALAGSAEREQASEPAERPGRSGRRRADVIDGSPHSLVGMAQRPSDADRGRRGGREGAARAGSEHRDPVRRVRQRDRGQGCRRAGS